jgi:archaeal type IV pilus assembly protein PilA
MNFRKIKNNFRRNAKAISPVIATLLMIAIAVVASLVTYAWVMGYMSFTTEKTGKAIQIQSVSNVTSPVNTMDIYVQNVGDSVVNFNNASVYVNGANIACNATLNPLAAGATTKLSVNYDTTITGITMTVDIKVTTEDGTFSTVKKTFP